MSEPLTESQIERLLDGHWNRNEPDEVCDECRSTWPCPLKQAVDELLELRAFAALVRPLVAAVEALTGRADPSPKKPAIKAPRWGLSENVMILPPKSRRG